MKIWMQKHRIFATLIPVLLVMVMIFLCSREKML